MNLPLCWWLCVFIVLLFAVGFAHVRQTRAWRPVAGVLRNIVADPVFYLGLAFLCLLTVQWWNAGRTLTFDALRGKWTYSPPPVPWLPFAFARDEARQMLAWFAPAWVLVLALRASRLEAAWFYRLWQCVAVNAGVLALAGICQFVARAQAVCWVRPADSGSFAGFGYANHAGAFFALMFCLSTGLLVRRLFQLGRRRPDLNAAALMAAALLTLTAVCLSLSRAAMMLSWASALFMGVYVVAYAWKRVKPSSRVNLVAAILGLFCIGYFVVAGDARDVVLREFSSLGRSGPGTFLRGRLMFSGPAVRIWQDHPWFGVGGWGFRYLLAMYVPSSKWWFIRICEGAANVHNDPMQFLVEFGAVGIGLMAGVALVLARRALHGRPWRHPATALAALGLAVTLVHSLVDLPFRCPAILYSWLVILVGVGELGRSSSLPISRVRKTMRYDAQIHTKEFR